MLVLLTSADPQPASAIVDSWNTQLEAAARCCPIGASTINVDDDTEHINNNVVIDPALPTAPHPLIKGTRESIDRPSVDELAQHVVHFDASGIWEPL